MRREPVREGGLASAHERIAGLLEELNETVVLVERLTKLGDADAALKMVEEQRSALYLAIDSISRDVGNDRQGWWESARRHVTTMVAAAALVLSSLAVSVAAIRQTPIERATAGLNKAREISDPVERLKVLREVVEIVRTQPRDVLVDSGIATSLAASADETKRELDGDDDADPTLQEQAEQLAADAKNLEPPGTQPPPPPSQDRSPLEEIGEVVDTSAAPRPAE